VFTVSQHYPSAAAASKTMDPDRKRAERPRTAEQSPAAERYDEYAVLVLMS
jgi:hypothetical protein